MQHQKRLVEELDTSLTHKRRRTEPANSEVSSGDLTSVAQLQRLLDFSSLENETEISHRFDDIANKLLLGFRLVVNKVELEILELEFYLWKDKIHEDPFTHGSEEQKVLGRWYFHRAPRRSENSHESRTSTKGYRGGTRKGLDLTISGSVSSSYFASQDESTTRGGILLRSLRTKNAQVISGPSLLVDHILSLSEASSIQDLVEGRWGGDISAFRKADNSMFLRPLATPPVNSATVHRSPRIGLELSHPGTTPSMSHPRVVFVAKPYRYFTHPELLTSNGRAQTFLGLLNAQLDTGESFSSETLRRYLATACGLKEKTVSSYLSDYTSGLNKGVLKMFVGPPGKGASSSASKYLQMMGARERERKCNVQQE